MWIKRQSSFSLNDLQKKKQRKGFDWVTYCVAKPPNHPDTSSTQVFKLTLIHAPENLQICGVHWLQRMFCFIRENSNINVQNWSVKESGWSTCLLLPIIDKYGVPISQWAYLYQELNIGGVNELWKNIHADDWTAKRAIIASNVLVRRDTKVPQVTYLEVYLFIPSVWKWLGKNINWFV